MALNLAQKQAIVAEVSNVAKSAVSVVTADYRGISVPHLTELRKKARESGVYMRIVRNTLASRALEGTEFDCVRKTLVGPLVFAFSVTEPSAAARLFRDFAKTNDKLKVQSISLGGDLLSASQLDAVASLPTKDEAISKLMSCMQAPITKFVRTLVAPQEKLVRTLLAVKEKKEAA